MKKKVKLFIADDHQMFIDGLKSLLSETAWIEIIGEANNGNEVIEQMNTLQPDVILLDIGMPELNGIETTIYLTEKQPSIKIIALTMYDDQHRVSKMLKAGVKGYLLKNTSKNELLEAIEAVTKDETYLSPQLEKFALNNEKTEDQSLISKLTKREIEIIKLIVQSSTNKEIADKLFLSELTINTHRKNAMRKLELKNTAGLVQFAIENNINDL